MYFLQLYSSLEISRHIELLQSRSTNEQWIIQEKRISNKWEIFVINSWFHVIFEKLLSEILYKMINEWFCILIPYNMSILPYSMIWYRNALNVLYSKVWRCMEIPILQMTALVLNIHIFWFWIHLATIFYECYHWWW